MTMFIIGSLIAGALAYELKTNEGLLQWDATIAKAFRDTQINAPWNWMEDLLFGIFLGKEGVALTGTILAIYFLHKRFWRELSMLVIALSGGVGIWYVLSRYIDRPRPRDHLDVLQLSGPSFPSGTVLVSLLCYGLLAYVLIPNISSRGWKWFLTLGCTLMICVVAVSSLLFGTHYATDVIAGLALGIAWAGLVFTLVEKVFAGETIRERERVRTATAFDGLRATGFFKDHPTFGLVLVLLSILVFAILGNNILMQGPLAQLDGSVYHDLLVRAKAASPAVNDLMLFGFFLGKQAIQYIVLFLSLYFLYQRYWLEFAMIQISMQGGGLLKNWIIDYFARPRPPEQLGLVITTLPSFPSGHSMGTIICYGFLAYLLVPKMPSRFWKWILSLGILLLVLFEGFSRIFHANHYLTDVLAGYALGLAWLVLVCTVMEKIFLRHPANPE
jgi:undecaprenyl-diphosphatase